MDWALKLIIGIVLLLAAVALTMWLREPPSSPAEIWHTNSWMERDGKAPTPHPPRVLAIIDLPRLEPIPTADDFVAAHNKSTRAGCRGATLTFSWPSLSPRKGDFTLSDLEGAATLNQGRVLYLGIQVLNTTVKELPDDLEQKPLDDPEVVARFAELLDGLAPFLRNRVTYLSIGNESDIYLSMHPNEVGPFQRFLEASRTHARTLAPGLVVGTTLTEAGALDPDLASLTREMDAHFLTYYHGQVGVESAYRDTSRTAAHLVRLVTSLDKRPVLFQEIGFPAAAPGTSPAMQAAFVDGVFDAWETLGSRVPFLSYFLLYDFPPAFVAQQASYYGVAGGDPAFTGFIGSLGLHDANGHARPAWQIFAKRGAALSPAKQAQ